MAISISATWGAGGLELSSPLTTYIHHIASDIDEEMWADDLMETQLSTKALDLYIDFIYIYKISFVCIFHSIIMLFIKFNILFY